MLLRGRRRPDSSAAPASTDGVAGSAPVIDLTEAESPLGGVFAVGYAAFPDAPGPAPTDGSTESSAESSAESFDRVRYEADAQRYSAWADRLRDKRERDQATILGRPVDPNGSAGYWSSESVCGDDDPVNDPGIVLDHRRKGRLLLELGLEAGATADDASAAYRGLAKVHHPDRWVEADEVTRTAHAEEMLRINAVYRVLRQEFKA